MVNRTTALLLAASVCVVLFASAARRRSRAARRGAQSIYASGRMRKEQTTPLLGVDTNHWMGTQGLVLGVGLESTNS